MNLIFRLLYTLLTEWFKPKADPMDDVELTFTTLPNDLDTNLHMNNGRYLTIMDLGRLSFMMRTGLWKYVLKRQWNPILGSAVISFRTGLKLWERYTLTTHIRCWDDRWFYIEQRFTRHGEVLAVGYVKAAIHSKEDGFIAPSELVTLLGHDPNDKEHPPDDMITHWMNAEATMVQTAKAEVEKTA